MIFFDLSICQFLLFLLLLVVGYRLRCSIRVLLRIGPLQRRWRGRRTRARWSRWRFVLLASSCGRSGCWLGAGTTCLLLQLRSEIMKIIKFIAFIGFLFQHRETIGMKSNLC